MREHERIAALELQVGELQRKLDFVMNHLGIRYAEPREHPAVAEAIECLRRGDKIEAITRYRAATGLGLKESKDAVEALEARLAAK